MSTLLQIENAVRSLAKDELNHFRKWFEAFDADDWDRQIEDDANAGRLDDLADEALSDLQAGRCQDL